MATNTSSDRIDGSRSLELGIALYWLKEQLAARVSDGSRTISATGSRTREEQELFGTAQILSVMFPLAIELALKSLKKKLHIRCEYHRGHKLDELFSSLTRDATDTADAQAAQVEARNFWVKHQIAGKVQYTGSIDDFLIEHSTDFIDIRYYDWSNFNTSINDLLLCFFSIIQPLIARDPETKANFDELNLMRAMAIASPSTRS